MGNDAIQKTTLCEMLGIQYPIIMAPMFLVSNVDMLVAGINAGITGAIPAMNFRTTAELRSAIHLIRKQCDGPFGINLIVNKSNFLYKEQLELICAEKVDFIITSLGSPEETIRVAHQAGVKVFCDVTDVKYAQKVEKLGADALIAVNKEAGGHAGNLSYTELIPLLQNACSIPIISAGGVGDSTSYQKMMKMGIAGVSVGTVFIASTESGVSNEYKQACVDYQAKDIVMTTKLSGTPCTVINTPYVQQIGTHQNMLEKILNGNKRLKKWFKAFTFYRGMKKLEHAAFAATYKTVWCAGPTVDYIHAIRPIHSIVKSIVNDEK
ncbi:MAG: nitronate monooxygenase [Crocinitomicaceae bacterium]|nr:MAG: nitronate monooxygenase [Crocinitomicaceae bacterium]